MAAEQRIERYRRARETGDTDELAGLVHPDASYRSNVFREPFPGRQAIAAYWRGTAPGSQREVAVRMGVPLIAAGRAAVEWASATCADLLKHADQDNLRAGEHPADARSCSPVIGREDAGGGSL